MRKQKREEIKADEAKKKKRGPKPKEPVHPDDNNSMEEALEQEDQKMKAERENEGHSGDETRGPNEGGQARRGRGRGRGRGKAKPRKNNCGDKEPANEKPDQELGHEKPAEEPANKEKESANDEKKPDKKRKPAPNDKAHCFNLTFKPLIGFVPQLVLKRPHYCNIAVPTG